MAKIGEKTVFFCKECGYESAKWMGQCPGCRQWNTFVEEKIKQTVATGKSASGKSASKSAGERTKVLTFEEISVDRTKRTSTGFTELDRVLGGMDENGVGGGIVSGSLILVGGDPGIGKSTLLLQVMYRLAKQEKKILYVSGEESAEQIKLRAERLGSFDQRMKLLCETDLNDVEAAIRNEMPDFAVIDSIQTMFSEDLSSAPGSVSQIREATAIFMQLAKGLGITIFLVGHVTKEGVVAGPRVLEHMVDTVLYFEGDRYASYRVLRGVKNRFGSTNEIGVFEMAEEGLKEVTNPSEYMLEERPEAASGAICACSMEGTRPILLEIQALVTQTAFGIPRRMATGADVNRVNLMIAVLERHCHLSLSNQDAYLNIAGGIRMKEPAVDLGLLLAIVSSYRDLPIPDKTMCFGEVGLSGEIRGVSQAKQRVKEAKKLGFTVCIAPKSNARAIGLVEGIEIRYVKNVSEALAAAGLGKK